MNSVARLGSFVVSRKRVDIALLHRAARRDIRA